MGTGSDGGGDCSAFEIAMFWERIFGESLGARPDPGVGLARCTRQGSGLVSGLLQGAVRGKYMADLVVRKSSSSN